MPQNLLHLLARALLRALVITVASIEAGSVSAVLQISHLPFGCFEVYRYRPVWRSSFDVPLSVAIIRQC